MTKCSAYTLASMEAKLKEVFRLFIEGDEDFHTCRRAFREEFRALAKKYPRDTKVNDFLNEWLDLRNRRKTGLSREDEEEQLVWLLSELSHIVNWRKLGVSGGRVLPFRDFRSMRGDRGHRGH